MTMCAGLLPFRPGGVLARVVVPFVLLVLGASAGNAEDSQLYASTLTTLAASAGGTAIGTVQPSTPLTVKGHKGGYVKVEITGWSPAGGDLYLFKDAGIRINMLKLNDKGRKNRVGHDSKEDDYGASWQYTTVTGWIAAKDTSTDLDGIWRAAGDIYFSHCTRCHSLRRPGDFTANQWPQALKVMTVRAGLNPEETALVTMLLQNHGKDRNLEDAFTQEVATKPAPAPAEVEEVKGTPELAAKGAELFKSANCIACHGEDAKTPIMPQYPKLAGQAATYVFKQVMDFKSGARSNDTDSVMRNNVAPLSDADIKAIAWWLSTL